MGKGFSGVPQNIVQEAEKIREKLKVTGIVYDLKHEPTTKYDTKVEKTTKYDTITKPTTLWETVKKICIQWVTKIEYCTRWVTDIKYSTKWETQTKPTTEYIRETKPTVEFVRETKPTIDYIRKEVPYSIEELVEKALKDLVDKNAVPVPKPKFTQQTIIVSEFVIKCPECGCSHSIGGMKV